MALALDLTTGIVYLKGGFTFTAASTVTRDAIGVTSTDGFVLQNTTAAAAGAQQMSPRIRFDGFGWKTDATAASQAVSFITEVLPVQGAAAPTANLLWKYAVNGGAYAARLTLSSDGTLSLVDGSASAPSLTFANATTTGLYRVGTNTAGITLSNIASVPFGIEGTATARTGFLGDVLGGIGVQLDLTTNNVLRLLTGGGSDLATMRAATHHADVAFTFGGSGVATSTYSFAKKVTGIADAVATDVLTITIPNADHAAAVRLLFLSSNGGADSFESNRAAHGLVVFQRSSGAVAVATAAAIADEIIATDATGGSATHTLAYNVSAVTGAAGASNSFTIQVTINDSGNLGSNQVVVLTELLNAEATGITIA